jgi:hypothetical protein
MRLWRPVFSLCNFLLTIERGLTDGLGRYSEILDYHNVDDGATSMDATNGQ